MKINMPKRTMICVVLSYSELKKDVIVKNVIVLDAFVLVFSSKLNISLQNCPISFTMFQYRTKLNA